MTLDRSAPTWPLNLAVKRLREILTNVYCKPSEGCASSASTSHGPITILQGQETASNGALIPSSLAHVPSAIWAQHLPCDDLRLAGQVDGSPGNVIRLPVDPWASAPR
jgi:hypothetical protein